MGSEHNGMLLTFYPSWGVKAQRNRGVKQKRNEGVKGERNMQQGISVHGWQLSQYAKAARRQPRRRHVDVSCQKSVKFKNEKEIGKPAIPLSSLKRAPDAFKFASKRLDN